MKDSDEISTISFRFHRIGDMDLGIFDETPMCPSPMFTLANTVVREAQGFTGDDGPLFGRAVMMFGGDLRQIGPIAGETETSGQIHFRNSEIMRKCTVLHLTQNMRVDPVAVEFSDLLKRVGEGRHPTIPGMDKSIFRIPDGWVLDNITDLCKWAFRNDPSVTGEKSAILTQTNADCNRINLAV